VEFVYRLAIWCIICVDLRKGIHLASPADNMLTLASLAGCDDSVQKELSTCLEKYASSRAILSHLEKISGYDNLKAYKELKEERLRKRVKA
jgi:hypothetical protein